MDNFKVLDQTSDEELIKLYQEGKIEIGDYLIERFFPLVLSCSRHLFLTGQEQDDLYQEGTVGLFKAFRDFDSNKKVKFSTFASVCIMRQQTKAIEASNRMKHFPLNNYLSIYEDDDNHVALIDSLESNEYDDPEKLFLAIDSYKDALEKIQSVLSPMENKVLELYLKGLDYKAIGKALDKEEKSIDNAIQRIRNKVKKLEI
ncbi:MAG: sigma-70 family RNA polymerase sigma factor [Lachnospiraceae bacterium]|nr:sigma-70 family RNA polymerase sigma factor [Lachnospiraceae bacterium]